MAEYPKCDFCSAPFPAWVHPSADFIMAEGWASADGAWAACDTCHELIEAEDRRALAERAFRTVPGGVPRAARNEVRTKIQRMHQGFWKGRNGVPYRQTYVQDAQHRQEGQR